MLHTQEWRIHRNNHHQHFSVSLALNEREVEEAQRLRYRVFVEELGARSHARVAGVDADIYDRHCKHLIVRDQSNAGAGRVVGTYRILTPDTASRAGNYCIENAFDLTRLRYLRENMVEVGRSCIHPDYRNGTVIALLWSKLAEFMARHDYRTLIGCASVSMADGGHNAANLFGQLLDTHIAPLEYCVFPRERLPFERLFTGRAAAIPPLLKGYLRAGAWVCGEPTWNADFNTADLPLLLPMSRITPRYARHLVRG